MAIDWLVLAILFFGPCIYIYAWFQVDHADVSKIPASWMVQAVAVIGIVTFKLYMVERLD